MMKLLLVFYLIHLNMVGLTLFDSTLYSIEENFKEYIEANPQFKIYEYIINDVIDEMKFKENKASRIAQECLLLSILCQGFCEKKMLKKKDIKHQFDMCIKKISKKKPINNNYFSLLMISEAYIIFSQIQQYKEYAMSIASEWFDQKSYFGEDGVEYTGPNLKKAISKDNSVLIKENIFGPVYFVFLYALTKIVYDVLK